MADTPKINIVPLDCTKLIERGDDMSEPAPEPESQAGCQCQGECEHPAKDREQIYCRDLRAEVAQLQQNEGVLFRRLSDAVSNGNAGTWDDIERALAQLRQERERALDILAPSMNVITNDMRSTYESYREAVHLLEASGQIVAARRTAIDIRDVFEARVRAGYLDPMFYGAVIPLSIESIRATGDLLHAALRTP